MDPIDVAIGGRIRARRRDIRMPAKTLAKAIGVSCQQLNKYESGANRIAAGRLAAIAETLSARPESFFVWDVETPLPAEYVVEVETDAGGVSVVARCATLLIGRAAYRQALKEMAASSIILLRSGTEVIMRSRTE